VILPMKLFNAMLFPLSLAVLLLASACQDSGDLGGSPEFRSTIDSVSYSLGYYYGSSIADEGIEDFNYRNFVQAMQVAIERQDPVFDELEMQGALQNFQMELQREQEQRRLEQSESNRTASEAFLTENSQRDDVSVTESGLQYRVIEEGEGQRPSASSRVQVHYRGTLINGEEFDSSYSRGQPAEFPLNQVIPGWTEGLQLMRAGSTYEFFIPSALGYGNNPPPGSPIEPGSVLVFEVELLDILD